VISIGKEEKAYFNIGNNQYYEGYHIKDSRWNGFATPSFEKEIADIIAHNFSTSNFKINYDKKKNCYVIKEYEDFKVVNTYSFEKVTIDTHDGKKEVYPLGAYYWTWDDYTLDEVKNNSQAYIISKDKEIQKEIQMDYDY